LKTFTDNTLYPAKKRDIKDMHKQFVRVDPHYWFEQLVEEQSKEISRCIPEQLT
jgi:hypothetical protein